jgi:hypothetical protein
VLPECVCTDYSVIFPRGTNIHVNTDAPPFAGTDQVLIMCLKRGLASDQRTKGKLLQAILNSDGIHLVVSTYTRFGVPFIVLLTVAATYAVAVNPSLQRCHRTTSIACNILSWTAFITHLTRIQDLYSHGAH